MLRDTDIPLAGGSLAVEDLRTRLRRQVREADLSWPPVPTRHETGDLLTIAALGVSPAVPARIDLLLERFVGGGFAGQVYRARILKVEAEGAAPEGLEEGGICAVKILRPPSRAKALFRDALYWLGFQAPFSSQLLSSAVRAGVLWQKLARRAAEIRLGDPGAIVDPYATFYDDELRSFGELSEWVDGRVWSLEMDPHVFARRRVDPRNRGAVDSALGSREYLAKKGFMADLVGLLHEIGAHELARQYVWWTAKSQPNVLKRLAAGEGPWDGLVAIDFRAGLALLPFLPMSPADFGLILSGMWRGSLVQFDRGDLAALERFVDEHAERFEDLRGALAELREADPAYRRSLPDVTHHHVRLVFDGGVRRGCVEGLCEAWERKGTIDARGRERLSASRLRFLAFFLSPVIPLAGAVGRRLWGNRAYARHAARWFADANYRSRALLADQCARLLDWHRKGRLSDERAAILERRRKGYWVERFTLGLLPRFLHRTITDPRYAWGKLKRMVTFPLRLYFNAAFRQAWFLEEIRRGREDGMLTGEEAERISASAVDPFIQTYLKALAVHIACMPVTHVVAGILALYVMFFRGLPWEQATAWGVGILVAFQVTPISPGSICRWLYVVYLVIRDRKFKRYRVAFFVAMWKYIGYLAFPFQMATTYPALARFLACRWATDAVHFVPVFGERGALLERLVFDGFFNAPISIGRARQERKARKARLAAPESGG